MARQNAVDLFAEAPRHVTIAARRRFAGVARAAARLPYYSPGSQKLTPPSSANAVDEAMPNASAVKSVLAAERCEARSLR